MGAKRPLRLVYIKEYNFENTIKNILFIVKDNFTSMFRQHVNTNKNENNFLKKNVYFIVPIVRELMVYSQ